MGHLVFNSLLPTSALKNLSEKTLLHDPLLQKKYVLARTYTLDGVSYLHTVLSNGDVCHGNGDVKNKRPKIVGHFYCNH